MATAPGSHWNEFISDRLTKIEVNVVQLQPQRRRRVKENKEDWGVARLQIQQIRNLQVTELVGVALTWPQAKPRQGKVENIAATTINPYNGMARYRAIRF